MNNDSLIHMLCAIKAQLSALQEQVDAALSALVQPQDGGCPHLPSDRINVTVMGGPTQWQCRACDFIHTEPD